VSPSSSANRDPSSTIGFSILDPREIMASLRLRASTSAAIAAGALVIAPRASPAAPAPLAAAGAGRALGGGGDHLALMRCYNEWIDTDYSTQWCFENFLQVRSLNKAPWITVR
jgi:hypothetical protein